MCDHCIKHGAAGKWYLNAKNYSYEIVEEYDLREFLMEQYKNFEQIAVRKVAGFSGIGLGYKMQMPWISGVRRSRKQRHQGIPRSLSGVGHAETQVELRRLLPRFGIIWSRMGSKGRSMFK